MSVNNSITRKRRDAELKTALTILNEDHSKNAHKHEHFLAVTHIVHAIIDERTNLDQVKKHGVKCKDCLSTIIHHLGSELDQARTFVTINYGEVDDRIFSRISFIEANIPAAEISFKKIGVEWTGYLIIRNLINNSLIEEACSALDDIKNQDFLFDKPIDHLLRRLLGVRASKKEVRFIQAAINSNFITTEKIIESYDEFISYQLSEEKIHPINSLLKSA